LPAALLGHVGPRPTGLVGVIGVVPAAGFSAFP
jgi:hypothetical protein